MVDEQAIVLDVASVSCGYHGHTIIENVSFRIERGTWLGLIGPNGSGKSTLLKAITGQLPLFSGAISICGEDIRSSPKKAKVCFGYAVDGGDLPENLTGKQYLELVASIRECTPASWADCDLIKELEFDRWIDEEIGSYSLGTRMKLSISAALLDSPPLIILDESLNGLDPVASWKVRKILSNLVSSGQHSVILSTHILETIGAFCTRAILLEDGKLSHEWTHSQLLAARESGEGFEAAVMSLISA